MSNDVLRWIIGLAVLGHGLGHVLFMPLFAGTLKVEANGHSWLLTDMLGKGVTQALATIIAAVALGIFVVAGIGLLGETAWWRPLSIVGAVVSLALVAVMWDGLPVSSAYFAVTFDVAVLVGIVWIHWPAPDVIGA